MSAGKEQQNEKAADDHKSLQSLHESMNQKLLAIQLRKEQENQEKRAKQQALEQQKRQDREEREKKHQERIKELEVDQSEYIKRKTSHWMVRPEYLLGTKNGNADNIKVEKSRVRFSTVDIMETTTPGDIEALISSSSGRRYRSSNYTIAKPFIPEKRADMHDTIPAVLISTWDELPSSIDVDNDDVLLDHYSGLPGKRNEEAVEKCNLFEEGAPYVIILPGDEAEVAQQDEQTYSNFRKIFLSVCGVALILVTGLMILSSFISALYYCSGHQQQADMNENSTMRRQQCYSYYYHTDPMIFVTVLCGPLGIIVFRLFPQASTRVVIRLHVMTSVITTLSFFGAAAQAFYLNWIAQILHFNSLHSLIGLVVVVLVFSVNITGIIGLVCPSKVKATGHSSMGLFAFGLCAITCVSGIANRSIIMDTEAKVNTMQAFLVDLQGGLLIITCIIISVLITSYEFRRRMKPEWDLIFARTIRSFEDDYIDDSNATLQYHYIRSLRHS